MADQYTNTLPIVTTVDYLIGDKIVDGKASTSRIARENITNGASPSDITAVADRATALEADLASGSKVGKKWTDIASASTTNLAGAAGSYGDVTGTTTITALGTATAGIRRTVRFTGVLTLTHNATSLILPTRANIVTEAGDVAAFVSLGSGNWCCVEYLRASGKRLANNPATDADAVAGTRTDVDMTPANTKAAIAARADPQDAKLSALATSINTTNNIMDEITDGTSALFIDPYFYTKSVTTPGSVEDVTIASRDSNTTFTVASGKGSKFAAFGAVAVKDGATGLIDSYTIKSVSGDQITVFETLPASISHAGMMFADSLHPGRLALQGLADYIAGRTIKRAYRKAALFEYNGALSASGGTADIYDLAGTTMLIDVVPLGGAVTSGFVTGTTNLSRLIRHEDASHNTGVLGPADFTARGYSLKQGVAGAGYEFPIQVLKRDGFIEVDIACRAESYVDSGDGLTKLTAGRVRVQVVSGATTFLDQTLSPGAITRLTADFSSVDTLTLRVTLLDSVPTSCLLQGVYVYGKSPKTSTARIWENGDVVAFLGDSWTQYPTPISGETALTRPDGSTGDGMQYLSERLRTTLAGLGVTITTLNMGKSGTTSAWGRYWIDSIINLSPKPTKCIINFAINDNASRSTAGGSSSQYDFDGANQWAFKLQSSGGMDGSVTTQQWLDNMAYISRRLIAAGIKPVIIMPPHVSTAATSQTIRDQLRALILRGFEAATA